MGDRITVNVYNNGKKRKSYTPDHIAAMSNN